MVSGLTLKAFWYGALGTIIGTLVSFKIVGPAMGKDGWKVDHFLLNLHYLFFIQIWGLSICISLANGFSFIYVLLLWKCIHQIVSGLISIHLHILIFSDRFITLCQLYWRYHQLCSNISSKMSIHSRSH